MSLGFIADDFVAALGLQQVLAHHSLTGRMMDATGILLCATLFVKTCGMHCVHTVLFNLVVWARPGLTQTNL